MRALDRKLLRDLRRLWAQTLAIALVLASGVAVLLLSMAAQRSLYETREAYYERSRFANVFAAATRAPLPLGEALARIPGVAQVELRIAGQAILDLPGLREPASARILSLPEDGMPAVNAPSLKEGRLPDPLRPEEIAVHEGFAEAHGFRPGDRFGAIVHGQRRDFLIAGIVYSPEYVFTIGPGAIVPDNLRFGVIWMSRDSAAAAFDLDGAFNDLALRLTRGASEPAVIDAVDRLLAPYGGTGAHGRDRQVSHAFLDGELEQLRAMATVLPPVFFVIAAFLVNMVLARLIALERGQIGLFKALGYTDAEVGWHYFKLAALIGVVGVVIGWGFGIWGGRALTRLYGDFYRFPYLVFLGGPDIMALAALAGLAATVGGALRAVRGAVRLLPAVAMTPPVPPHYRRGLADRVARALGLPQLSTMILRSIGRWPGRAAVTVFGVSASLATLVASLFTFDAVDHVIDLSLYQASRQTVSLTFVEARPDAILTEIARLPGVMAAEGARVLPVRLANGAKSRLTVIEARPPEAALTQVLDTDGRPVAMPEAGLLLPKTLAHRIGAERGELLTVELLEGSRETLHVPVAGIVQQYFGEAAYMDAAALARLLREDPRITTAHLLVDPAALGALYDAVKATPAVAGLSATEEVRTQFRETVGSNMSVSAGIYTALGAVIAIGVAYNAARIQLSERAHELASLRVLGFTRAEVSYVLVGELMLLTVVAVPVGWLLGYGFAAAVAAAFSTDIITVPLVVERGTFGYATVIVTLSALCSALLVRRQIDRLDLVAVLKTRE
jgi:putative ABC transport system permease protein